MDSLAAGAGDSSEGGIQGAVGALNLTDAQLHMDISDLQDERDRLTAEIEEKRRTLAGLKSENGELEEEARGAGADIEELRGHQDALKDLAEQVKGEGKGAIAVAGVQRLGDDGDPEIELRHPTSLYGAEARTKSRGGSPEDADGDGEGDNVWPEGSPNGSSCDGVDMALFVKKSKYVALKRQFEDFVKAMRDKFGDEAVDEAIEEIGGEGAVVMANLL